MPTVRSADSTLTAGATTDALTAAAPAAWKGSTVDFVLFPAGAASGQRTGSLVASARLTGGVAAAAWQPATGTAPGTYVLVAELDPAGFLPFPSAPSAPVTIRLSPEPLTDSTNIHHRADRKIAALLVAPGAETISPGRAR